MKPLFTIHVGEFLVGCEIERQRDFRHINIWVLASKDVGVDILLSNKTNKTTVSIQVKFSRDYLNTHNEIRASGWWQIERKSLEISPADYWILVLMGLTDRSTAIRSEDFIIIKPDELLRRLDAIHGTDGKKPERFNSYLRVTKKRKCWETRRLNKSDELRIAEGNFECDARDFTAYLNNWKPIIKALDE